MRKTRVGPYDFCNHGVADRIAELINKNRIYYKIRNITELTAVWLKFCFLEKERHFSGENIPGGLLRRETTRMSFDKHSCLPPEQCKHVEADARDASKLRNLSLILKYRAEQFPNDFYVSGDLLFCKFCQHTVDWQHVDTCKDLLQSKVHVKNKAELVSEV